MNAGQGEIQFITIYINGFNGIEHVVTLNMKIEKLHKDRLYNYVYDKF